MENRPMTKADALQIAQWQYPDDYALYNEPDFSQLSEQQLRHYYSFFEQNELIGFINLLEEETEVFFGIGVNPAFCSHGFGTAITRKAIDIAKRNWPTKPLYLEVRTWNQRAVVCYKKAGFVITKTFQMTTHLGAGTFYRMETNTPMDQAKIIEAQ